LDATFVRLQRATTSTLKAITIDVLGLDKGDTLPKGDVYRERLGVGSGTVQQAFSILSDAGALKTKSRGHLGRVITTLRPSRLWQLAGLDPVRFILPPRGPGEVRAMAEFITEAMSGVGIPCVIDHVGGARRRFAAIESGKADVVCVSSGFADLELSQARSDIGLIRHPRGTYYAPGRLVVLRHPARPTGRRVAIDPTSADQAGLTRAEFPADQGYEYVETDFPSIPVKLLAGVVDASIWHEMRTLIPPRLAGLEVDQPTRPATRELLDRSSAAVFVYSTRRSELHAIVGALGSSKFAAAVAACTDPQADAADRVDLAWVV
jgi:hypothetical protein